MSPKIYQLRFCFSFGTTEKKQISEMKSLIFCLIFGVFVVDYFSATVVEDDNSDLRGMIKMLQVKNIILNYKIVKMSLSTQFFYLHFFSDKMNQYRLLSLQHEVRSLNLKLKANEEITKVRGICFLIFRCLNFFPFYFIFSHYQFVIHFNAFHNLVHNFYLYIY